jgi:lysophospholipase L1-like esterase
MRIRIMAVAIAALAAVLGLSTTPAFAAPLVKPAQFYLALGDSLAAGYQPGQGDNKTGGYVGRVWHAAYALVPHTALVNDACSGETTTTMINGGICTYDHGSQLNEAVAFLRAHHNFTTLITIDIGANDVDQCVVGGVIDFPCVQQGINTLQQNLPTIYNSLVTAAPNAKIIAVNYYDPFLAAWLQRTPEGRSTAKASVSLAGSINNLIFQAAVGGLDLDYADVAATFKTTDFTTILDQPYGHIPVNVAKICQWTYMCTLGNIHPNDGGYAAIARTVIPIL